MNLDCGVWFLYSYIIHLCFVILQWRGKWRAGVQCSLEDCPAQTVQAMPTYGRKSYILVFFPKNHSFVWTDWQLTCCISENPQPLSFGSHKSGRNSVVDLNIAKTFMLRKIATSMLDISDQLPVTVKILETMQNF